MPTYVSIRCTCRKGEGMDCQRSLVTAVLLSLGGLAGCLDAPTTASEPPASEVASTVTSGVTEGQDGASQLLGDRACTWSQWGRSATHDGQTCARGQQPSNILHHIVYDPFEFQEMAEGGGDLFIHYQVPLNDENGNFYMMQKGGTYTSCDPPGSGTPAPCGIDQANIVKMTWSENKYRRRHDGSFEQVWSFQSGWKPFPVFLWEPMFQPALSGPLLY